MTGRPRHGQSALASGRHINADDAAFVLVEGTDGDDLQGLGIQERVVITDLALAVGLDASQRLEVEGVALSITDVKAQVGGRPVAPGWRTGRPMAVGVTFACPQEDTAAPRTPVPRSASILLRLVSHVMGAVFQSYERYSDRTVSRLSL